MSDFVTTLLVLIGLSFLFNFVFELLFNSFVNYIFKICVKQRTAIKQVKRFLMRKRGESNWSDEDFLVCLDYLDCGEGKVENVN